MEEQRVAIYLDFENLAISAEEFEHEFAPTNRV